MNDPWYKQVRVNSWVRDTWYGLGRVVKVVHGRVYIKMDASGNIWDYDKEHFKQFVVIENNLNSKNR